MNLQELLERSRTLRTSDALRSTEVPTNIVKLELPEVMSGVRLGMHTDTVGNLLRVLRDIPEASCLRFEARVLNPAQRRELDRNRAYRFYMSGRFVRSGRDYGIVLSAGFNPTGEEVSRWASSPFSPRTLSRAIGYQVAYIDINGCMPGNPTDQLMLMGAIGGCNELNIGSDNVEPSRLAAIVERIKRGLSGLDLAIRIPYVPIPSSSNFYKILQNTSDKKIYSNIIFSNKDDNNRKYIMDKIRPPSH